MMKKNRRRKLAMAAAVVGLLVWTAAPALAHGENNDSGAVELVEQALAIVVNSPGASGEALERIEAALEAETEEPSGKLDIVSLELAVDALRQGDMHDAEDALVTALGIDPHAGSADPTVTAEAPPPSEPAADPVEAVDDTSAEAPGVVEDAHVEDPKTVDDDHSEEADDTTRAHGLTERIDGGFRAPGGTAIIELGAAALLAVGGLAMVLNKGGRS